MAGSRESGAWANAYGGLGQSTGPRMVELPLSQLDPWRGQDGSPQPFRKYTPEKLQELVESIKTYGVLEAIHVRPHNGRFQILAGHNRCNAAALAGLKKIPAILDDVDDNTAILIMVESNLRHREKLLPSEKAHAYKMQMDALKHQGSTCGQVGHKSRDEISNDESGRQIQRYLRLNFLNPVLLDKVDAEIIGMTTGVDLSYIPAADQEVLVEVMNANGIDKISGVQARKLRRIESFTPESICEVFHIGVEDKKSAALPIKLDLSKYTSRIMLRLKRDPAFLTAMQQAMEDYIQTSGITEE